MLLWIMFAALTAAVVALIARPLVASHEQLDAGGDTEAALNIYRDQLAEVDREQSRGLIGEAEAEAARSEVARRLIARADDKSATALDGAGAPSQIWRSKAATAALACIPLLAVLLYVRVGSPQVASQPYAERAAVRPDSASVEDLIARVEARLAEDPEDGAGWDVIGPIYLRLERYDAALNAFANAIRLKGESMPRLSGLAEAAVASAQGGVPEVARQAYARIVAREPGRLDARFWLAVAKEQDGRRDQARAEYEAILKESPPGAPWRQHVGERLVAVGGSPPADGAVPTTAGQAGGQTGSDMPRTSPGPGQAEVEAAARMSPQERTAMIAGMVEGLAARLAENGADAAGWQRLIRAYIVLGDKEKAATALGQARKALASDPAGLAATEAAARQLGLGS